MIKYCIDLSDVISYCIRILYQVLIWCELMTDLIESEVRGQFYGFL